MDPRWTAKAYEIRMKVICTNPCHTDIIFSQGKDLLGHEACGYVSRILPLMST
uniref:Uncharacterized protein n=1 Tax=Triticum urartu TaxID=4572 RepID=A0A8R7TCL7_TRIUA